MPRRPDIPRHMDLYFASGKERDEFVAWAKKCGCPLSAFFVGKLREIRDSEEHGAKPRISLKEIEHLKGRIKILERELADKDIALDALRRSEERARDLAHLVDQDGKRAGNVQLKLVLKEHGPVHEGPLLSLLGIEGDRERCRAIGRQLEALEEYGVVKKTGFGWRWVG